MAYLLVRNRDNPGGDATHYAGDPVSAFDNTRDPRTASKITKANGFYVIHVPDMPTQEARLLCAPGDVGPKAPAGLAHVNPAAAREYERVAPKKHKRMTRRNMPLGSVTFDDAGFAVLDRATVLGLFKRKV